ncbi:MAG: TraR/DksA family transcriptional regulator [Betaproteobacteria bacterium]|nr:TraR/DksA family transcriptional regulator [Betaproteobacteria bacterium]
MHYFTIEQREALQAQLRALVERLRGEIAGAMHLPKHSEETDDDAVADLETDLDIAELERATQLLRSAEAALARLHEPEFGLCEDCGAEIPYSRLRTNPVATRCIDCQRTRERGDAQAARL